MAIVHDQALIEAAQRSDRAAIQRLLVSCQLDLRRGVVGVRDARGRGRCRAGQTMVQVYQRIAAPRTVASYSAWVFALCGASATGCCDTCAAAPNLPMTTRRPSPTSSIWVCRSISRRPSSRSLTSTAWRSSYRLRGKLDHRNRRQPATHPRSGQEPHPSQTPGDP